MAILCLIAVFGIMALALWFEMTDNGEAQAILCFGATAAFVVVIGMSVQ